MLNRTVLTTRLVNSLLKREFEVFLTHGCFDIAAKREKLVLIKSLINIDGLNVWGRTKDVVVIGYGFSDLDTYLEILDSPETAAAMEYDGVKRETVKVFVLDKELQV